MNTIDHSPRLVGIDLWVRRHAKQVHTVQLMEDLKANTVASLASLGVGDLE